MKDSLGDRMKSFYEVRSKHSLLRRSYTIIRVDGCHFHTYTRGCQKPFDDRLMADMDATAKFMCEEIHGARLAFVQSDEISVLLTDFEKINTEAWFDGNIQKITSVSSSFATAKFNELRPGKLAYFDSRVFTIPCYTEVENYLIWRQQNATRNSISSVAQSLYSHKELHKKSSNEQQELIFQKGHNWNDLSSRYKRGRMVLKELFDKDGSERSRWVISDVPIFSADRDFMKKIIPVNE